MFGSGVLRFWPEAARLCSAYPTPALGPKRWVLSALGVPAFAEHANRPQCSAANLLTKTRHGGWRRTLPSCWGCGGGRKRKASRRSLARSNDAISLVAPAFGACTQVRL